jgi:uncharacterized membrane protein YfcA
MLWSGISVMRGRKGAPAADEDEAASSERPSIAVLGAVGAGAGFVAGLLGVGGGIVLVPAMTGVLRVPMKRAVASSLVGVAIFSIPALITHAVLGHIDWSFALPLMAGVVPGARLGARFTLRQSDRSVRRIFGLGVIVLALVYGGSELAALL